MRARVNTVKHIVQLPLVTVGVGLFNQAVLVDAITKGGARTSTRDVEEGAIISACFVEFWIVNEGNAPGQFVCALLKLPAGVDPPDATDMLNLQAYPNKKNILFTSQGVLQSGAVQAVPIIRNWYKIPKGKQRFGLGDRLVFMTQAVGEDIDRCGVSVYKEQY